MLRGHRLTRYDSRTELRGSTIQSTYMELQRLYFSEGHWLAGDYHWRIRNVFVPSRYKLIPIDGAPDPSNGEHKGFIVRESILRIVWGGDYYAGMMMNQQFADYKLEHCKEEYDAFEAGLLRGYEGERGCRDSYISKQSKDWIFGYRAGRRVKLEEAQEANKRR